MNIRPATEQDLARIEQIINAVWQDNHGAIAYFTTRLPKPNSQNHVLVAEAQDSAGIVGCATLGYGRLHNHHAYVSIHVLPEYQRRGIGTQLFTAIQAISCQYQPLPFHTATYDYCHDALDFWRTHGFVHESKTFLPVLDVTTLDQAVFKRDLAIVQHAGIVIEPYSALAHDPQRDDQVAELLWNAYARIHPESPPNPICYAERHELFLDDAMIAESMFIAHQHGQYRGVASLRASDEPDSLDADFIAVAPEVAAIEQHVACALFAYLVDHAREQNIRYIYAEVDQDDELGMMLLAKLPFTHQPVWLRLTTDKEPA